MVIHFQLDHWEHISDKWRRALNIVQENVTTYKCRTYVWFKFLVIWGNNLTLHITSFSHPVIGSGSSIHCRNPLCLGPSENCCFYINMSPYHNGRGLWGRMSDHWFSATAFILLIYPIQKTKDINPVQNIEAWTDVTIKTHVKTRVPEGNSVILSNWNSLHYSWTSSTINHNWFGDDVHSLSLWQIVFGTWSMSCISIFSLS